MALLRLISVVPAAQRSWIADFPMKPLHPTFTGWMVAVHPPSLHSAARSEYLSRLNSCAACIPSSHGTVSSIMRAFLAAVAHTTASGLNVVWVISDGKISWVPRSTRISQQTCCPPRHCLLPAFSWSEERNVWVKGNWRAICPDSTSFQLLRQLPQHLIMPPPKATLRQCNVTPRQDMLKACVGFNAQGELVLTSEPLGEILGTREGVIRCPHEEAEPWRRSSPDICPGYVPVTDVLPAGPCSLFALGNSLDEVTVLFHLWDLFHHDGLPLLSCGFGPKLDWLSKNWWGFVKCELKSSQLKEPKT